MRVLLLLSLQGNEQDHVMEQMEIPSNRSSSVTTWLVGGILLVAIAAVVIAFVPLVECPDCEGSAERKILIGLGTHPYYRNESCPRCSKTGKLSLLNRWTHPTDEQAR